MRRRAIDNLIHLSHPTRQRRGHPAGQVRDTSSFTVGGTGCIPLPGVDRPSCAFGWYALQRGIATTIAGVSKGPTASKGLLRHTTVLTTARHYIKDAPKTTLSAMQSLEAVCKAYAKA